MKIEDQVNNTNNYQKAAKARAEQELLENPDKYKNLGKLGGSVKVKKGFAKNPQALQLAVARSVASRKLKREEQSN